MPVVPGSWSGAAGGHGDLVMLSWFRMTQYVMFSFRPPPELNKEDKEGAISTCLIEAVINPEQQKRQKTFRFK